MIEYFIAIKLSTSFFPGSHYDPKKNQQEQGQLEDQEQGQLEAQQGRLDQDQGRLEDQDQDQGQAGVTGQ